MHALIRLATFWGANTLILWLVGALVPGVRFADTRALLVAGLVIGLANAVVKPVLLLLTLPLTLLTLGLFLLVLNGLVLWAVSGLVSGFQLAGFGSAVLAALVFGVLAFLLNTLFGLRA